MASEPEVKITGKRFEKLIDERLAWCRKNMLADAGKYGVQGAFQPEGEWRAQPSKPDYEGVVVGGRQFVFDAKVCSQSSFNLDKYTTKIVDGKKKRGSRRRQIDFMYNRSQFGAVCGLLIHWNPRELTRKTYCAETYWLPVSRDSSFWQCVESGSIRSITRSDCRMVGIRVDWTMTGRKTDPVPEITNVIKSIMRASK